MRIAGVDVELISLPAVTPAISPGGAGFGARTMPGRRPSSASRPRTAPSVRPTTSGAGRCSPTSSTASSGRSSSASAPTAASGSGIGSGSSTAPRSSRSGSSASSTSRSGTSRAGSSACRSIACSAPTATRSRRTPRPSTFSTIEEYLDVADQCLELGYPAIKLHAWGDARADAELCQRLRAHVGDRRRPDVRRIGRVRPARRRVPRPRPRRSRGTAGTRSRCASSTSRRTGGSSERVERPAARRGDLRREPSEHRRFHRVGLRHVRPHEREPPRRHHRRDADRPPRRLVPPPREPHGPTEPAVHLCMAIPNCTYYESLVNSNPVTREPRVGPDGLVHAPTEPGIALPDFVQELACRSARLKNAEQPYEGGAHMKVKRRWFALTSLARLATAAALVAASTGGASSAQGIRLDHSLGRRRPPAGHEALREDASQRAAEDRHLRR